MAILLAVSVTVAGCTVSHTADKDQYGTYLSELNSGNAEFNMGHTQYDDAMSAFDNQISFDAINDMSDAVSYYSIAMEHYGWMSDNASGQDQKAYADALKSYAQYCMYAANDYFTAYKYFNAGDSIHGNACLNEAAGYVAQANQYHDQAVKAQPMAVT